MARPVVGVIANAHVVEKRFSLQAVGERSLRAVADVSGALPLMFAGAPEITDIGALLEVVDGVLLTGARANVHPARFNTQPHPGYAPYDERRDALALALIEVCVAEGVPLFGVCRGFQEMNVAFGGTPDFTNRTMSIIPAGGKNVGGLLWYQTLPQLATYQTFISNAATNRWASTAWNGTTDAAGTIGQLISRESQIVPYAGNIVCRQTMYILAK